MSWNRGKRWAPSEEQLKEIETLSGVGSPMYEIAAILGISKDTIEKASKKNDALRTAIERGRAKANAAVGQSLFRQAIGGYTKTIIDKNGKAIEVKSEPNVSAAIFWAKTRMRWRETAPEGEQADNQRVVIILPENGRETKK